MPADLKKVAAALAQSAPGLGVKPADETAAAAELEAEVTGSAFMDAEEDREESEGGYDDAEPDDVDDTETVMADTQTHADAQPGTDATPAATAAQSATYTPEQIAAWQRAAELERLVQENPALVLDFLQKQVGVQPGATSNVVPEYNLTEKDGSPEEFTTPERLAWETLRDPERRTFLAEGPKQIKAMQQATAEALVWRDFGLASLSEQISTLADALGVELPAVDATSVDALMRQGQKLTDAVKKAYEPHRTKVKELAKAKTKPQPRTPSSAGGDDGAIPPLPVTASLAEQIAWEKKYLKGKR